MPQWGCGKKITEASVKLLVVWPFMLIKLTYRNHVKSQDQMIKAASGHILLAGCQNLQEPGRSTYWQLNGSILQNAYPAHSTWAYICNRSAISTSLAMSANSELLLQTPGMDVARKVLTLARECGLCLELKDVKVESLLPEDMPPELTSQEFLSRFFQVLLPRHPACMLAFPAGLCTALIPHATCASIFSVLCGIIFGA